MRAPRYVFGDKGIVVELTSRAFMMMVVALGIGPSIMAGAPQPQSAELVIVVAPNGNDAAAGTPEHPFRTLQRAQEAVRSANAERDVMVELADGVYPLSATLVFRQQDGGRSGHKVLWTAMPNAHPVLSGAIRISTWKIWDRGRQIYVADVPPGLDSRQLWVNNKLMSSASIELRRSDVTFTSQGITVKPEASGILRSLQTAHRLEIRATGFFTDRISPVERVTGDTLIMREPAWDNNLWGYDTIERPFHPELAHLYIANALELMKWPGEWYLDPGEGKLYLSLPNGADPNGMDVELPRLTVLVSIGNSLDQPVQDLSFRGVRFSYTTWLGPSGNEGYASQQSGSYLAGHALAYPLDPIQTCAQGCPEFESVRNEWKQMPASVQVSAAQRITFQDDVFAHLGQYALGIGNDADATYSGTGLATSDITVVANLFTDVAGGAILAGGVQREAHHPGDPRQIDRQLIIRSNRIAGVSREYLDNSAILSTYVDGAVILHNDISDVPYDAVDIGYGWGINDPGGNANYRVRMHGYEWPQNLVYTTPTPHRDVVVANNRIHGAKKLFHDGGAIYNLSASPGTLITENYVFDNNGQIGLYLDEGSRYIMIRRNVVQDRNSEWLNINTVHAAYPLRISPDNTAMDNWHDSARTGGLWTNYQNDLILDDHLVKDNSWPPEAEQIMKNSGVESQFEPSAYDDAQSAAGEQIHPGEGTGPAVRQK